MQWFPVAFCISMPLNLQKVSSAVFVPNVIRKRNRGTGHILFGTFSASMRRKVYCVLLNEPEVNSAASLITEPPVGR